MKSHPRSRLKAAGEAATPHAANRSETASLAAIEADLESMSTTIKQLEVLADKLEAKLAERQSPAGDEGRA